MSPEGACPAEPGLLLLGRVELGAVLADQAVGRELAGVAVHRGGVVEAELLGDLGGRDARALGDGGHKLLAPARTKTRRGLARRARALACSSPRLRSRCGGSGRAAAAGCRGAPPGRRLAP